MYKGKLSRSQAVALVGEGLINKVEAENCDFTGRVMPPGFDDREEFSAGVRGTDLNGEGCTVLAYYYQDKDEVAACEELSQLDWEIYGYAVEY